MNVKTFRAKTMQQALDLVRHELGPSASVLHTREVNGGFVKRIVFGRQYEVAASATVHVPSRLPAELQTRWAGRASDSPECTSAVPPAHLDVDYRLQYRDDFRRQVAGQLDELQAMVE